MSTEGLPQSVVPTKARLHCALRHSSCIFIMQTSKKTKKMQSHLSVGFLKIVLFIFCKHLGLVPAAELVLVLKGDYQVRKPANV